MSGILGRRPRLLGLLLVALGVGLVGTGWARAGQPPGTAAAPLAPQAVAAGIVRGSLEQQFVPVAPCRILDTRYAGGAMTDSVRSFTAFAPYAAQGGSASGCGIPATATALHVNVGAISLGNVGWVTGWPAASAEPNASLVNFTPSGPIANMVTLPVSAGTTSFRLRVTGSAHVFADVAGYYTPSLFAAVEPAGDVYAGIASGLSSVSRIGTGEYLVTFERSVIGCSAVVSDIVFPATHDLSADVTYNRGNPNSLTVVAVNAAGAREDTYFSVQISC